MFLYSLFDMPIGWPSDEMVYGPAPINWCEPDYVHDAWVGGVQVAELHNTITNVSYMIASVLLYFEWWRILSSRRQKMQIGFYRHALVMFYVVFLFLLGVWSGIFHATLLWGAQKLDEICENCCMIALFHISGGIGRSSVSKHTDGDGGKTLRTILVHSAVVALGIWCIPLYFCELHMITVTVVTVYRLSKGVDLTPMQKRSVQYAACAAGTGFALWLVDLLACEHVMQACVAMGLGRWHVPLHAYGWHVLTAVALYEAGKILQSVILLGAGEASAAEE